MQPLFTGLEAVNAAGEVKLLDGIPAFMPTYHMDFLLNPDLISFWRNIMKKYMPFSPELQAKAEGCLKRLPFHSRYRGSGKGNFIMMPV